MDNSLPTMTVDQVFTDIAPDSYQGITLDEFLTVGASTGEGSTGEVSRRKRGILEMNGPACSTSKEKRIIKNRESAARSRERKQAYTLELESLVAKLEEENSMMRTQQKEVKQMRLKQLLDNIIPVTERKKPPGPSLRRTLSL